MSNVWENGDAFMMALRLRRKGVVYPDVEEVFASVVTSIVKMSTVLLVKRSAKYRRYAALFMEEDTQSQMVLNALTVLGKADTGKKPRVVINYVVKTVQNRLRDLVRNTQIHDRRAQFVTEHEIGTGLDYLSVVSDFYGETRRAASGRKVITQEKPKHNTEEVYNGQ